MKIFLADHPTGSALGKELVQVFSTQGKTVINLRSGQPTPRAYYDVLIDIDSRSATDIRTRLSHLDGCFSHYVLVSSFRVYPPGSRLRPWTEPDADAALDLSLRLPAPALACRAMERELRLLARNRFNVTILRPALVESEDSGEAITRWFVERVIHGGLVVLPEGDLPLYRQVSAQDLANAITMIAGQPIAFGQVLNVASQATLSYWGHAAIVRDGLGLPLRFGYVPSWRWRGANLRLPLGELGHSSLIETSPLLHQLGWKAEDPLSFIMGLARRIATSDNEIYQHEREIERRILRETESESLFSPGISPAPLASHSTPQWVLRGWSSQPASLTLERIATLQGLPAPLVKVKALTLTAAEECFLRGEYPQNGQRAIGHNALLEIIEEGSSGLKKGTLAVPLATLPCGVPECPFCSSNVHAVLGIGCDGYGWGTCTTPPTHLLPVPSEVGQLALLADPLAALLSVLSEPLSQDKGIVWISGRTYEAALVAWLAADAGRVVRMVDRRSWDHDEFPVTSVEPSLAAVQAGTLERPTLAIDFSGSTDVSWPMTQALANGSALYARRRPPGVAESIRWHLLPAAAPNRSYLEVAMARLQYWMTFRAVGRRLGPSVPLDIFWDALLPSPFSLPWLEDRQ